MKALASKAQNIKRSGIREILEIAMRTPGCIRLEVGEPNFPTPAHIVEAAHKAAQEGYTKYTLGGGMLQLREGLIEKLTRFNGLKNLTVDNILVTPGSVFSLAAAMDALLEPGDEVLLPDPAWPVYEAQVGLSSGVAKFYTCYPEDGFVPRLENIESLITPRTKAIVICNPSNPTGAVYPREVMEAIIRLARQHDLYVISDEVYEQLIFEGQPTTAALIDPERVIGVYSFSKTYSMTGWRVGYAVAQPGLIGVMSRLLEPHLSCTAMPNQMAALAALKGPQDCIEEMRTAYQRRRDLVCDILKEHDLYQYRPSGAFYVMVDISRTGMDSYDFCRALVAEKQVSTAPGATFGPSSGQLVRLSLATAEDELIEGVNRLCTFIEEKAESKVGISY
jgi:aspartate aminotransferase/aminotransferase